jgi:hypothetical protein
MPTPQEQEKARKLKHVAKLAFGQLYPTEIKLLNNATRSLNESILAGQPDKETDYDAVIDGEKWGREREIRSKVLRWLCVDEYAKNQIDVHGLNVTGAKITDSLDLSFVTVPFGLSLQQCYFEEPLTLYQCELLGLTLTGSYARGVNLNDSKIKGTLNLDEGFRCDGLVDIQSAHIGGSLHCSGGTFTSPNRYDPTTGKWDPNSGTSLNADGAVIEGFVHLRREEDSQTTFRSEGMVRFVGAKIHGDLDCAGGHFLNLPKKAFPNSGVALNGCRVTISGSIFLTEGFRAEGKVWLNDAQVESSLECEGGTFTNPSQKEDNIGGVALEMDRAVIKGAVLLRTAEDTTAESQREFSADGKISLVDVSIGGALDLYEGNFQNATLDLSGATAASLLDSGRKSWPKQNNLYLWLFRYGHLDPVGAEERLKWLSLQPYDEFNTQSYVQLANVLQQSGDDDGARLVLQTAAELQTQHGHPFWYTRPDNWFAASIGYGYRPIRALGYSSIMTALGWIIYRRAYLAGTIVPTDKDAYNDVKSKHCLPPSYPRFAPLIFSLENSLPLVKLGQADKWQPDAQSATQLSPAVKAGPLATSPLTEIPRCTETRSNAQDDASEKSLTDECPAGRSMEHPETAISPSDRQLITGSLPSFFAVARRRIHDVLCAAGLELHAGEEPLRKPSSHWGSSGRFLMWFIWIQIILGWLFATLFVAGVTGIVRKQ